MTTGGNAFGFQTRTIGPFSVLQTPKLFLQMDTVNSLSIIAVARPDMHNGGILYDHVADHLSLFVGDGMMAPIEAISIAQDGTITFNGTPSFSGDLDMGGNNILNVGDIELASITAANGSNFVINDDIIATGHDLALNAINVNQGGGGGAVRVHSTSGATVNELRTDNTGQLRSSNALGGYVVGLFRPRFMQSAITAGVTQTPMALNTTVYSLLGDWGTPTGIEFGWTADAPVAGARRVTYNGTTSRMVKISCDMTYSTSAADQFELGFYKNATISGGNVISTGPISGSFHRLNNTGLTLPRNSFHVITSVAANDTFMIGVQCAVNAPLVFQAISASWTVEDFSNGTD